MTARGALGYVHWYLREVSGETAYDRYKAHREKQHPDEPVMTRRDFERWRMDELGRNPRARCC